MRDSCPNLLYICFVLAIILLAGCQRKSPPDGFSVENQMLHLNHLNKDFADAALLDSVMANINCADSSILGKKLVLAEHFHSADTTEILLIPYISGGKRFSSSAYSDIKNRVILINPRYIKEAAEQYTLSGSTSYKPLLSLMLLHEIGHFILKKAGAFDKISDVSTNHLGQKMSDTEPEFMTSLKKVELAADSLAIDMVKRKLSPANTKCLDIALSVELMVPGMQYQLSGRRMIDNFGAQNIGFLHDPSNDHPNLELRITFMNYFLFPSDSLRNMIDDYIYNRTVAPVHQQELDPSIYQGQGKVPLFKR